MSHEIYYTSAPEGTRPGQHGFCTVATTSGIPRPLQDRLESVSGYRHQFSGTGSEDRNPVAWAHWLVQVQGREVSVLSRICDAGLDYTQRTNAFAHHLALEPAERAVAGPAWMLSRPGVMATTWDGQVGSIVRTAPLPDFEVRPNRCEEWHRITGDAGWAGVLAEAAIKHPRRPVCLLFSPGQNVLPLIAEAIALLPPGRRWEVSFNTYFTGLPGNTTCAWRCCLAGTPAAADAARHAAGSLVLDLAHPERLCIAPNSPYVEQARNGGPVNDLTPTVTIPFTRIRSATFMPVGVAPLLKTPPKHSFGPLHLAASAPTDAGRVMVAEVEAVDLTETGIVDISWTGIRRRSRQRWLLAFAALAMLFVGMGIWLQWISQKRSAQIGQSRPGEQAAMEPETQSSLATNLLEGNESGSAPPPATQISVKAASTSSPTVQPPELTVSATQQSVAAATAPTAEPPAIIEPATLVLAAELDMPQTSGSGIRDPVQTVRLTPKQVGDLKSMVSVRVMLPGNGRSYSGLHAGLAGDLQVEPSARGKLRETIIWRDAANPAAPNEVADVAIELKGNDPNARVEVTWRSASMIRRPDVLALARAALQEAEIFVSDGAGFRIQKILFKPLAPIDIDIAAPSSLLVLPVLPSKVALRPERDLPAGWHAIWEENRVRTRAATEREAGTAGVLRFERPAEQDGAICRFEIRFSAARTRASSTWAEQRRLVQVTAANAAAELARADQELARVRDSSRSIQAPLERELQEAAGQTALTDGELSGRLTTRAALGQRIERARAALAEANAKLEAEIQQALTLRERTAAARVALDTAANSFNQMKDVAVVVELPDRLRVATLRLTIVQPVPPPP